MDIELNKKDESTKTIELVVSKELENYKNELLEQNFTLLDMKPCINLLNSQDTKKILQAVITCRKLLEVDEPYIQEFIDYSLVPRFISLLKESNFHHYIHLECLFSFGLVCRLGSKYLGKCLNEGIIEVLISYFTHENIQIQEQAIRLLGTISESDYIYIEGRNVEDCFKKLFEIIEPLMEDKKQLPEYLLQLLMNLCSREFRLDYEELEFLSIIFAYILKNDKIDDTKTFYALKSLAILTDNQQCFVNLAFQVNILNELVRCLDSKLQSIVQYSLQVIGNMLTGTEEQTSEILNQKNCLNSIFALLNSPKNIIRQNTLWVISNITVEEKFVDLVVQNDIVLKKIIEMSHNEKGHIKGEALYVLSNAAFSVDKVGNQKLIDYGILLSFKKGLFRSDEIAIIMCLEGIKSIFRKQEAASASNKNFTFAEDLMEQSGCLPIIEILSQHECTQIVLLCRELLQKFLYLKES